MEGFREVLGSWSLGEGGVVDDLRRRSSTCTPSTISRDFEFLHEPDADKTRACLRRSEHGGVSGGPGGRGQPGEGGVQVDDLRRRSSTCTPLHDPQSFDADKTSLSASTQTRPVLVCVGVNMEGFREVLGSGQAGLRRSER